MAIWAKSERFLLESDRVTRRHADCVHYWLRLYRIKTVSDMFRDKRVQDDYAFGIST